LAAALPLSAGTAMLQLRAELRDSEDDTGMGQRPSTRARMPRGDAAFLAGNLLRAITAVAGPGYTI